MKRLIHTSILRSVKPHLFCTDYTLSQLIYAILFRRVLFLLTLGYSIWVVGLKSSYLAYHIPSE